MTWVLCPDAKYEKRVPEGQFLTCITVLPARRVVDTYRLDALLWNPKTDVECRHLASSSYPFKTLRIRPPYALAHGLAEKLRHRP
jgi:hypothetical protein